MILPANLKNTIIYLTKYIVIKNMKITSYNFFATILLSSFICAKWGMADPVTINTAGTSGGVFVCNVDNKSTCHQTGGTSRLSEIGKEYESKPDTYICVSDHNGTCNQSAGTGWKVHYQSGVSIMTKLEGVKPISVCCFRTNQTTINSNVNDANTVETMLETLSAQRREDSKSNTVVIVGYTDERADDMFNMNLGIARAKMIATTICKRFSDFCGSPVKPIVMSCGEINANMESTKDQSQYRRVDVYFPGDEVTFDRKELCSRVQ